MDCFSAGNPSEGFPVPRYRVRFAPRGCATGWPPEAGKHWGHLARDSPYRGTGFASLPGDAQRAGRRRRANTGFALLPGDALR